VEAVLEKEIDYEYGSAENEQFLTFAIEDEIYGIPIENIKEIISVPDITPVPLTTDYIKGIINFRGEVIPVVDVRARFNKPEKEYDELSCIIVIEYEDSVLGLIVDNVKDVLFINRDDILSPPKARLKQPNQFIKNVGKIGDDLKLLLDLEKLLEDEK
jgi:purine-binding chemotaxis protein CheW